MNYIKKTLEALQREFMYRVVLYIIAIISFALAAWTTSSVKIAFATILIAIASSTFEIIYRIEKLKSEDRVELLQDEKSVEDNLQKIVKTANLNDTIWVSANEAPKEEEIKPDGYYNAIKNRAIRGEVILKRLAYIAPFEKDKKEYGERIEAIEKWLEKDRQEFKTAHKEKYFQVRYTYLPFFLLYIYLPTKEKCIFQMSLLSKPFTGHAMGALYIEGGVKLLNDSIGKMIDDYWANAYDSLEECKKEMEKRGA